MKLCSTIKKNCTSLFRSSANQLIISLANFIFVFQFSLFSQTALNSDLSTKLQQALDDKFNSYNLKGVAAALSMPNGDVWLGASGSSDGTDTIKTDMLFGIGSNTKTFTSSIIMLLTQDSLLSLEDSIYHWIPSYKFVDSTITIHQLLNHTSGIYDYAHSQAVQDSFLFDPAKFWTANEILSTFLDTAYFPKGTSYHYSNSEYLILGMIIEAVTGQTYIQQLHSRIIDPFNLSHTFLDQYDSLNGTMAHMWYDIFDNNTTYDLVALNVPRTALFSSSWSAGAIFSTAQDMVNWSKDLFQGKVVNDSSLQQMLDFLPTYNYGLGLMKFSISGRTLWGHDGDAVYMSMLTFSSYDTISIAILCNDGETTSSQLTALTKALLDTYINYFYAGIDELQQNTLEVSAYPNPFKNSTTIKYVLNETEEINIDVYDVLGKNIAHLYNGKQEKGNHEIEWDTKTKGMYLCRITYNNQTEIIILAKE